MTQPAAVAALRRGSVGEVFRVFLLLGVTSFGGPIAHLGYFRDELVARRRWLSEREYADLVALCQFLPGPASSQVGFSLGFLRAGALGAIAAFIGFTVPSAALMVAFAAGAPLLGGDFAAGALRGLTIVAVAIVAQAVWGMARTLTPDAARASIAVVAALTALFFPGALGQVVAIVLGALAGLAFCRTGAAEQSGAVSFPISRAAGLVCLALFAAILVGAPLVAALTGDGTARLFDVFSRAGALVFGGGHVVLPLLEAGVVTPGWVSAENFLSGYGAAQAVPGPLFTFASYLGAVSSVGPGGIAGGAIALVAIFLPGLLLVAGVLPFWDALRSKPGAQALMRGANAAVVGILAAALYTPVFTTAILDAASFGLALVCFVLLTAWKLPPWLVVVIAGAAGTLPPR